MSNKYESPDVLVLSSLNPIEQDGILVSPILGARIAEYQPYVYDMWGEFLESESGSLEELSKARKLADFYQLKTAQALQGVFGDKALWAERFNQSSDEIYGKVDPVEVGKIAKLELVELDNGVTDSALLDVYRKLSSATAGQEESTESADFDSFTKTILERFSGAREIIDRLPEGPYNSESIRSVFEEFLLTLAEQDADWQEWHITNNPVNTMLSVLPDKKEIDVPDRRQDVETKEEVFSLILHEFGVHAQRAINGYKTGDKLMSSGLPFYIDFEEGLGVLVEYLGANEDIDKIKDRYVGTALATGAIDGYFLDRNELILLAVEREKARAFVRAESFDPEKAHKSARDQADRIFRGGNGMPIFGEDGRIKVQSVFSKDIVYYGGFVKARNYIRQQLNDGVDPNRLMDFLLSGKFDPTNRLHLDYLKNKHSIEI